MAFRRDHAERPVLVLLIDDDTDLTEITSLSLAMAGLQVVTAPDGQAALRLLEVVRPHVIVCDMVMPVLDGFGFLKAYQRRAEPRAPVIAVSAFAAFVKEAQYMGAATGLTKPFQVDELVGAIRATAEGAPVPPSTTQLEVETDRERMRAILELNLDHPAPESELQRFTERVAGRFGVEMCLVSVITADRQFFQAGCRIPKTYSDQHGLPRSDSFCTHAVVARAALIVQDAYEHPFFRDNLTVREQGVRFYAGAPLLGRRGEALGTLCIVDSSPRTFTYFDLELLSLFARRVLAALEEREHQKNPNIPESTFRYLHYYDQELDVFGRGAFVDLAGVEGARAAERRDRLALALVVVERERLRTVARSLQAAIPRATVGRLAEQRLGVLVPSVFPDQARRLLMSLAGSDAVVVSLALEEYPGAYEAALRQLECSLGSREVE